MPSTAELIAQHKAETTPTSELIKAHQDELKSQRIKNTELESAALGAIQGATAGYADEGEAVIRTGLQAIKEPGKVKGLSDLIKSYRSNRESARGKYEQARADNPKSYTGGEVAGGVGSAFIPGFGWMNAAKGASVLTKMATAAKAGAAIGGGTSTADLTEGDVKGLAKDVATGAAIGAAAQGALSGAGQVVSGAAERFRSIPESRAVKAVTGQNISALRQITGTTLKSAGDVGDANKRLVKVGRDILDEPGVLGPLSKVEDIAPKLGKAREKYGKLIGEVGEQIDQLAPKSVDAKNIANKIMDYAESIPQTVQGQKLRDKLVEEAANFEKIGALDFVEAQRFKNQFKYKAVDADALISNQDAVNKVRSIVSQEMEDTVAKLSAPQEGVINMAKTGVKEAPQVEGLVREGSSFQTQEAAPLRDLIDNYKLYKSKYGSFKAASDAATDRVQKNLSIRFLSPSDQGLGAAVGLGSILNHGGLSPSAVATGLAAAGINKFARERGSALAAKTADSLIKAYDSEGVQGLVQAAKPVLEAARKGNPSAIITFQILDKKNPKALEALNQQEAMQRRMGRQ